MSITDRAMRMRHMSWHCKEVLCSLHCRPLILHQLRGVPSASEYRGCQMVLPVSDCCSSRALVAPSFHRSAL